jgi:hypothetical protein
VDAQTKKGFRLDAKKWVYSHNVVLELIPTRLRSAGNNAVPLRAPPRSSSTVLGYRAPRPLPDHPESRKTHQRGSHDVWTANSQLLPDPNLH